MTELQRLQKGAKRMLEESTSVAVVQMQIGWLIDNAKVIKDVLRAVSLIEEFETEEEFARQEALLNATIPLT